MNNDFMWKMMKLVFFQKVPLFFLRYETSLTKNFHIIVNYCFLTFFWGVNQFDVKRFFDCYSYLNLDPNLGKKCLFFQKADVIKNALWNFLFFFYVFRNCIWCSHFVPKIGFIYQWTWDLGVFTSSTPPNPHPPLQLNLTYIKIAFQE